MTDTDVAALMNDGYGWYKKWRGKEPAVDSPERVFYLDEINTLVSKYSRFEHIEVNCDPGSPHRGEDRVVKTALPLLMWFLNMLERRVYDREAAERNK